MPRKADTSGPLAHWCADDLEAMQLALDACRMTEEPVLWLKASRALQRVREAIGEMDEVICALPSGLENARAAGQEAHLRRLERRRQLQLPLFDTMTNGRRYRPPEAEKNWWIEAQKKVRLA